MLSLSERYRNEGRLDGAEDNKLDVAKEMLADGMDINMIVKYTKLTEQRVTELKAELEAASLRSVA